MDDPAKMERDMPTGLSVYAKRWLCPAQSWCIAGGFGLAD